MERLALNIIRTEHRALARVLKFILTLVNVHQREGAFPDFAVLRTVLFYIEEFTERRHHLKESTLIFPKLRARCPSKRDLLDHLDEDHAYGGRKIQNLQHALLAFEIMGEPRRSAFEQAAHEYVHFYLEHMSLEERELLPLAEQHLTQDDWTDIDEAFSGNHDALAGQVSEPDYEVMFSRILSFMLAPEGQALAC